MTESATRGLAERSSRIRYEDLDQATLTKAKMCILDQVGCMMLGASVPWTRSIYRYVSSRGGVPEARVIRQGDRLPVAAAAMVNAVYGQSCELDDYAIRKWGGGHAGSTAVPVALTVGELHRSSGRDVLAAVVAGYEVMGRLGKTVRPSSDKKGFHMHGILSPFGAAATAAHLMSIGEDELVQAFGIALSQASGTMEYDQSGGEVKRLHSGLGARAGVDSVYLALEGLTAPPTALEGKRGFFNVFSDAPNLEEMELEEGILAIDETAFKLYPCVATLASAIQAISELKAAHQIDPHNVVEIEVGMNEGTLLHGGGIVQPTDVLSAQFSLPFSLSLALGRGSNHLNNYTDREAWSDPELLQIGAKVRLQADAEAVGDLRHLCVMTVRMADGQDHHIRVKYPKGSLFDPLSPEDVQRKFFDMVDGLISDQDARRIVDAVEGLDRCTDITEIVELMCGGRK